MRGLREAQGIIEFPAGPRRAARRAEKPAAEADHRKEHRKRLRERFRRGGTDALQDYELLELVLFRAIPRKDVKGLAKELIKTFGGFAEAISAQYSM